MICSEWVLENRNSHSPKQNFQVGGSSGFELSSTFKAIHDFYFSRAWIPFRNVWDMSEKPTQKKRSKLLQQAEDELKIYMRLQAAAGRKSPQKVCYIHLKQIF